MLKPFLNVDFKHIPIYFIMMILGFCVAYKKLSVLLEKNEYSPSTSKNMKISFFFSAIAGLIGANAANWFLFEGLKTFPIYIRWTKGGFSFIFGLITFLIVSSVLLKLKNENVKDSLNLVVGPILIAHFFGRIGCSLRGCCWGKDILINGQEIMFPAREIEAIFLLIMSFLIPRISKKNTLWVYLSSYSIFRFIIEFFRGDDRGCLLGIEILSPSQVICLLLFALSVIMLFFNAQKLSLTKGTKGIIIAATVIVLTIVLIPMLIHKETDADSSNTEIVKLSYNEAVNLETGLSIINATNEWADADYVPWSEEILENGDKIYQYVQVVNERPVLGNVRILVTDDSSYPQYIIGDAAKQAFSTDILDNYIVNGVTLEDLLDENYDITESMLCWYDSGHGLVAAKHILLAKDGQEAVMGAVLQESDHKIICFTGPHLGILSDVSNDSIFFENQTIPKKSTKILNKQNYMTIAEFIEQLIEKFEISDKQANAIILSTNQIAKKASSLNVKLYGELLAAQVQSVLREEGYAEELIEEVCNEIYEYLSGTADEHLIKILPEDKKYTYKLNYAQDADIINIENPFAQTMELLIESEKPIQIEVYSKDGSSLNFIYVEDEEKILLYPEDGKSFLLKVSNGAFYDKNHENNYSITVNIEKENTKIPAKIGTTLYRIEKAYNQSNLLPFMMMYSTDKYPMAEGLLSALLVPIVDSCECQNENVGESDLAKESIVSILLGNYIDSNMDHWLFGSQMKISYASHIERENGYFVKANVYIENDGMVIYNGFTRFKLVKIEKNMPQESSGFEAIDKFFKKGLFITDVNTEELFSAFGEDINNENITSDLKSLYEFCEDYIDSECGVDIYVQRFNKIGALQNGHSEEKVEKFQEYIEKSNLSRYKQTKDEIQQKVELFSSLKTLYDVNDFISNPIKFLFEKGLDYWDKEFLSNLYTHLKLEIDFAGTTKDIAIDNIIDQMEKEVDELKDSLKKLDDKINRNSSATTNSRSTTGDAKRMINDTVKIFL